MRIPLIFLAVSVFSPLVSFGAEPCRKEAENVAFRTMELFTLNNPNLSCLAQGQLVSFEALEVETVMPLRYAFQADFEFPCPPYPRSPSVTILMNETCQIVDLQLQGFELASDLPPTEAQPIEVQ